MSRLQMMMINDVKQIFDYNITCLFCWAYNQFSSILASLTTLLLSYWVSKGMVAVLHH